MDITSQRNIKNLLKQSGIRPSKRLGQNFLVDKAALNRVVAAADLGPQDTVLEIGPGIGALTQELAEKAGKVIAVEKDRNMVRILKETLKDFKNIEIINEDARRFDLQTLRKSREVEPPAFKVVGNLPFYLTAPVIRKFLEMREVRPQSMTLVVQKEVGQRICSKPPRMSLLAVSVQFYAEPKIISYIPKNSFWPQPKVDGAILRIAPLINADRRPINADLFFRIVKAGFSQPRKQLINNLSRGLKIDKKKAGEWLLKNNIQPTQRAETLSVQNWLHLIKALK